MNPDTKTERLSTADLAQARTTRGAATAEGPAETPPEQVDDRREATPRATHVEDSAPLFSDEETQQLRGKWDAIQTAFVDEPRRAVENADELVASAMKRLAEIFARERETLEQQWDRGEQISTEDLRLAFQRYRSFFARILRV
jgi:hypothetical protein